MKSRFLYGISTRQASSVSVFGRFWWKGLRYVYFRKALTSGFRPSNRISNGLPKKTNAVDDSKLPKSSSSSGQQHQKSHLLQQQLQQRQRLRSTMRFKDVATLVWRAVKAASRRQNPNASSSTPPSLASRALGNSQPPLQAGITPKLSAVQSKPSQEEIRPDPNEDSLSKREVRPADISDFERHELLQREKQKLAKEVEEAIREETNCEREATFKFLNDQLTRVPENPVPTTRMPGDRNDARLSEGMIVYARRIPQLLTGMAASLGWPPPGPARDLKMDSDLPAISPKTLGIEEPSSRAVATAVPQPEPKEKGQSQPQSPATSMDAAALAAAAAAEAEAAQAIEALSLDSAKEQQQAQTKPLAAPSWKRQPAMWATHEAATSRTRYLMRAVATANTLMSQMTRVQDFCKHLVDNPQAKNLAVKERAIPLMLRLRTLNHDPEMKGYINEALALLGYISPLRGNGIRILCIDGGGTRGIMALEILRQFEQITCQPVHRLFDFMCGVSTGAILSVLLGAMKASMDECEELYKRTSSEIFNQNTWLGTGKLVLNHAFYDTDAWVKVLQKNIGEIPLIQTARDQDCPKIAAVSTIVNEPRLRAFLFRNYEYPHRHQSEFPGSNSPQLWEAIRASAAAPGYFEEYKLGDYVHQDGGILTNNPSALAIHECRHLWPNQPIQCVISLGNGRYEPQVPSNVSMSSLKQKLLKIVDSATDTEGVHMTLNDLLPPKRYYRFNPYLSGSFSLDEIRPEKFKQLQNDARMYIRKNEHKIREAAVQLLEPKSKIQQIKDTIKEKMMTYM